MQKIPTIFSSLGIAFALSLLAACSSAPTQKNGPTAQDQPKGKPASAPAGKVWIARADGSKSCGMQKGIAPEKAAEELEKLGVKVYQARAGTDGMMHMMVCGAATGNTVDALVDADKVSIAERYGFKVKTERIK